MTLLAVLTESRFETGLMHRAHSGPWTEGMTPEDKEIYMTVYQRLDQEAQEALNVQAYIQAQNEN